MSSLLFEKTDRAASVGKEPKAPGIWSIGLLAFLTGLLPCLLHNMLFCESRIMLATDGKHFLNTVALLTEYLKQYVGTPEAAQFLSNSQMPAHVMFDGPIMSLIYTPVFLVVNHLPGPRDWMILACGQSIFHGLSTAALSLLAYRVTQNKSFAILAALLFGLYPPALVQSGHFMSELPVTTLILLMLLCLSAKSKTVWQFLIAGVSATLVILSKPALIPAMLVATAYGAINQSKSDEKRSESDTISENRFVSRYRLFAWVRDFVLERQKAILCLALGLALVIVPWSMFSYATTGSFIPTAQRQPLYNVATGWNTEADGWAYNPHPKLTDLFTDAEGPLATAMGMWASHPQDCISLAFSKVSRLASCPWNDFKGRAIGIDENAQILIHRLLLFCAAFGAAIYAFCCRRYLNSNQRRPIELALLLIFSHLTYLMVECQPRYAFPAVPLAVLLAVYGIWQSSKLSFEDPQRRKIIFSSVIAALAISSLLLHSETICRFFDKRGIRECSHLLFKNETVTKQIDLSSVKKPPNIGTVILLVDGDKNLESCKLKFNGKELKEKLISTMHFDAGHYVLYDQLREFAPAMRISVDDFRQWRAVVVDKDLINWNGSNVIELQNQAKSATVYGDRLKTRYAYSPDYCNYGILAAAPFAAGAESRFIEPVLSAANQEHSFITSKGKSAANLKDALRVRLMAFYSYRPTVNNTPENKTSSSADDARSTKADSVSTNSQAKSIEISRSNFDPMLWDHDSSDCLRINKTILYAAKTVAANFPLPQIQNGSHLKLRISGELKALKNEGDVGISVALQGQNKVVQILGHTPRAIPATSKWSRFEINDLVPLLPLASSAESIQFSLFPCPWMEGQYGVSRRATDALFRNIKVEISPANLPEFSSTRVIY